MSIDILGNPGMPMCCLDKCITAGLCTLKGCRKQRLAEISAELAELQRSASVHVPSSFEMFDTRATDMADAIGLSAFKRYPEPGLSAGGMSTDFHIDTSLYPYVDDYEMQMFCAGNAYEQAIVDRHSTQGLKKHELTRSDKKEQLNAQGMGKFPADRDKLLDQLYPETAR